VQAPGSCGHSQGGSTAWPPRCTQPCQPHYVPVS
jgi:hypothetical protein